MTLTEPIYAVHNTSTWKNSVHEGVYYLLTHHGTLLGINEEGVLIQLSTMDTTEGRAIRIKHENGRYRAIDAPLRDYEVEVHSNRLSFKKDGRYLCAEAEYPICSINRISRGEWENFRIVDSCIANSDNYISYFFYNQDQERIGSDIYILVKIMENYDNILELTNYDKKMNFPKYLVEAIELAKNKKIYDPCRKNLMSNILVIYENDVENILSSPLQKSLLDSDILICLKEPHEWLSKIENLSKKLSKLENNSRVFDNIVAIIGKNFIYLSRWLPSQRGQYGVMKSYLHKREFLFKVEWYSVPNARTGPTFRIFQKILGDFVISSDKVAKLLIQYGDYAHQNIVSVAYCRPIEFENVRLIPDPFFLDSNGYLDLRKAALEGELPPWGARQDCVFWRGSATTNFRTPNGERISRIDQVPRVAMCLALRGIDRVDAGIMNSWLLANEIEFSEGGLEKWLDEQGILKAGKPMIQHANYKFLIDIDGVGNAWSFFEKMLLGSSILKIESSFEQWFYKDIKEWEHYVPVAYDFHDLIEKIQWCLDHDKECNEIAKRAQEFALQHTYEKAVSLMKETVRSLLGTNLEHMAAPMSESEQPKVAVTSQATTSKQAGCWSTPEEGFFAAIAQFQESINSAFPAGAKIAQREVERTLDGIFDAYAKARRFDLDIKFRFSDFDALGPIQPGLCIVQLEGRDAAISFPRRGWSPAWMGGRFLAVVEALEAAVSAGPPVSGTFFAALVDEGHEPALAFSTRHPQGCAIPDAHFFMNYGYARLRREIASRWIPWEEREQRIFWRGVTTGIRRFAPPPEGEPDDLRWLPRLELCLAARASRHAALFDVGLSKIVQIDEPHLVRRIEEAGLLRPEVPHIEFMNYKARVVIDGNANAWDAMFGSLLMGNCTFLVQSEHGWRQWYHDELRPWEHFIPVAADLSDLDERVDWYLAHQDEARAIAARGKELADRITFSEAYSNIVTPVRDWLPVGTARFRERVEKQGFRVTEFRTASGARPLRLQTHHGTVVFVQLATAAGVTSGTLRHGPEASSEKNIALIIRDGLAELVYIAPDGTYHGVSVTAQPLNQPVPPERRDGMPGPGRFEIIPIPGEPGGVALRRDGLCLCAEADGRVTLSREQIGAWEIFRLQLLDSVALPAGAAQGTEGEKSEAPRKTVRPLVIDRLWQGSDPFANFPAERYETDTQGWGSQHRYLTDAIDAFSPRVVVEIGVWKGASTMTMARRMKERGLDGVVIAVDTWLGSYDHWVSDEWRASLRFEHGYPALFGTFMANIVKSGLAEYVVPLPLDSINAAHVLRHFGIRADVIHIDGGHEYETVSRDLQVWWELLKPGGVLIGDDYDRGGSWPGVRRAFDEFFNALGLFPFEHEGGKCRILKPA